MGSMMMAAVSSGALLCFSSHFMASSGALQHLRAL